jgi:hypothetical protein
MMMSSANICIHKINVFLHHYRMLDCRMLDCRIYDNGYCGLKGYFTNSSGDHILFLINKHGGEMWHLCLELG